MSPPGTVKALTRLARSGYWEGQRYAGAHPETPLESLEYLAGIDHPPVIQEAVASNPGASEEILKKLSHAEYVRTRKSVAANRSSPQEVLMTLLEDQNPEVVSKAQKTLKEKK